MKKSPYAQLGATSVAVAALFAFATPAAADPTPECNNGAGLRSTECGANSAAPADDATAVGADAPPTM